jgi:N6-adenosine-specific RNA methylase IME4
METNKTKKLYKTLMCDPPWDLFQQGQRGAIRHYNLMTLDQIKTMPVADFVDKDSHCWLWVTNATLRHGYDVLEAWGFIPRSVLTWVKPRLGLGVYLRNSTEHILLGTRGKAPVLFNSQPTWMFAPLQDHSHKPEEIYPIIERVSSGPYLELFARRDQPGWHKWGNEVISDIEIPGYPVPRVRGKDEEDASK